MEGAHIKRGLEITMAQAQAHATRHGYQLDSFRNTPTSAAASQLDSGHPRTSNIAKIVKKDRMTRPEREMALILEAKKRRGEILEWRFEGISLAWGVDPENGKQMWYTPDFYVVKEELRAKSFSSYVCLLETKGAKLFNAQLVRFRGCRACWPNFHFELHQLEKGTWSRVE